MLSIVCWKWRPSGAYRSAFGPETVNTLRAMVERHYAKPHRFICVTDDAAGIDPRVEIVPLWSDNAELPNPMGKSMPSCYRRLKAFSQEASQWFGDRFVSLDLDSVITADMAPVWDRDEDFVIWGDTHPTTPYNGSMFLLRSGSKPQVWDTFDPADVAGQGQGGRLLRQRPGLDCILSGAAAAALGQAGRRLFVPGRHQDGRRRLSLPKGARIVMFHGTSIPGHPKPSGSAWVREHYR
jgi:hypothetical protein